MSRQRIGTGTLIVLAGIALALTGCAARVTKSAPSGTPVSVANASSKNIVLNITGSEVATTSKDWSRFKDVWVLSMHDEATSIGASFAAQDGPPKSTGESGTLVVVDVDDFRYLSTGARIAFGIMTGNAFIKAKARFVDLASGNSLGERNYDTTSTTWQGVFSAMTVKQVQAICKDVGEEIAPH